MTPIERYQQDIKDRLLLPDPAQYQAILCLQRVYEEIVALENNYRKWKGLKRWVTFAKQQPIKGLYLWGAVGRGKTYLMDILVNCLTTPRKLRMHFHIFMQSIHQQLKQLQGRRDPLICIAKNLKQQADIIFIDEFFVSDIGDAMVLSNFLKAFINEGICLVTTSNIPPDELYKNGLQRDLFLKAIDLINHSMQVFHLQADQDYRLRTLKEAGVYFYPLNNQTSDKMYAIFKSLAKDQPQPIKTILIEGREIQVRACVNQVIWFDFEVICNVPRSQNDYIAIAQHYSTILISNVPQMKSQETNKVIYFIKLVDIVYDLKSKLILSAAVPLEEIYPVGEKKFEFQRTLSRLQEMQSQAYLSLPSYHEVDSLQHSSTQHYDWVE